MRMSREFIATQKNDAHKAPVKEPVQLDLFKDKPENAQDTTTKGNTKGKRWG